VKSISSIILHKSLEVIGDTIGGTKVLMFDVDKTIPCESTVVLRGPSKLALAEAERAFHDAICVVRNLMKQPVSSRT
jgi:chaperonin GroEL (HSP60 family)